jgi:hypothetical protein
MKNVRLHPLSFLAGLGLAAVAFVGLGLRSGPVADEWEYRIENDVDAKDVDGLARDGWEFAGYLGSGIKSADNDETLWRKKK